MVIFVDKSVLTPGFPSSFYVGSSGEKSKTYYICLSDGFWSQQRDSVENTQFLYHKFSFVIILIIREM